MNLATPTRPPPANGWGAPAGLRIDVSNRTLVAWQDGDLVGLLHLQPDSEIEADTDSADERVQLWVDPARRRQGIGLALLHKGLEQARRLGLDHLFASFPAGAADALDLLRVTTPTARVHAAGGSCLVEIDLAANGPASGPPRPRTPGPNT